MPWTSPERGRCGRTRPRDDRSGDGYLADSVPMGETTVTTLEGRSAGRADTPSTDETAGTGAPLQRLRTPRRPRIWFEILLIAVSYWTYSLIRNAVPEQKAAGAAQRRLDLEGGARTSASPSRRRSTTP